MSAIELSPSQRQILRALVDIHGKEDSVVKGKEIAQRIDRNPGTIRNKMQSLKALGLVEGIPGPKGGYKPTSSAYEVLDLEGIEEEAEVRVLRGGEPVEGLNVTDINFTNVHHPDVCRAEIRIKGSIQAFSQGDQIEVGPTPVSKLVVRATVDGKDTSNNTLLCKIDSMEAPAE